MAMKVCLVFVTHNRLEYTRLSLASVLADPLEEFSLIIWDNGSTDGTLEYLKREVNDPRIEDIVLSKENAGQTGAMNYAWGRTDAELVGKIDNDCLVTPGWTRTLARAHEDVANLGVVACWHFFAQDFDFDRAKNKIQTFGSHQIFRHPWVGGTGFLMKRETFMRLGPWRQGADVGTTYYFLRMALAGCINGFYYPLVYQEHMDDPDSPHCLITDEISFAKYRHITFGLKTGRYRDVAGRKKRRDGIVRNLLDDPFDPRWYAPWKCKARSLCARAISLGRQITGGKRSA